MSHYITMQSINKQSDPQERDRLLTSSQEEKGIQTNILAHKSERIKNKLSMFNNNLAKCTNVLRHNHSSLRNLERNLHRFQISYFLAATRRTCCLAY